MAGIAGAAEPVSYGTLSVKALVNRTVICVRLFISITAFRIFNTYCKGTDCFRLEITVKTTVA